MILERKMLSNRKRTCPTDTLRTVDRTFIGLGMHSRFPVREWRLTAGETARHGMSRHGTARHGTAYVFILRIKGRTRHSVNDTVSK